MSTLTTTTSVSIALGRFCVGESEEAIIHTPAAMAMAAPHTTKSALSRDLDDDDFDFEYFERTYKPLSNLPTPPPSSRNSVASSPVLGDDDDLDADTTLLGPAVHLTNLHPPGATITPPATTLVHTILTRAALPLETIALAVCILDSLDSKFSRKFRMTLPLAASPTTSNNKRHTITSAAANLLTHIDSVPPELLILTALVIAFKFTDDCTEPTAYFASAWARGLWTCDQINASERCIMDHLGYRILPLCEKGLIADAVEDMRRAGVMALREREVRMAAGAVAGKNVESGHARSISVPVPRTTGRAVVGLGFAMTPMDTPTEERERELLGF